MHYTTSFSLKESGHGILAAHHFLGIPTAPEFQMMPHRGLNLPQIHGWHFFKKKHDIAVGSNNAHFAKVFGKTPVCFASQL